MSFCDGIFRCMVVCVYVKVADLRFPKELNDFSALQSLLKFFICFFFGIYKGIQY